jgi:hypothetical protein
MFYEKIDNDLRTGLKYPFTGSGFNVQGFRVTALTFPSGH